MVGITQPRRVAAVAMAQRVAHELGDELGGRVAYQVDALSLTRPQTRAQTQSLTLTLPLPLTLTLALTLTLTPTLTLRLALTLTLTLTRTLPLSRYATRAPSRRSAASSS